MKRQIAILGAFAALLLLPLPALAAAEGHFERTLQVTGEPDVSVTTGSGNITVRAGGGTAVEIRARIHAHSGWFGMSGEDKVRQIEQNPPILQSGSMIRIGKIEDRELRENVSIDYDITVPARSTLNAETGSGDQNISGLQDRVHAHSGSGNLTLANISAEVRAESGSGDLDLSNLTGRMYVSTGSGSIRTSHVAGAFTGSSGSGDIHLDQTAAGDVKLETGSGNIKAYGVNGSLDVSTGSGDIEINGQQRGDWRLGAGSGNVRIRLDGQPSFDLDAETSSGDIDLGMPVTVQGSMGKHRIQGRVRNGGQLLRVHTGSGDIEVR